MGGGWWWAKPLQTLSQGLVCLLSIGPELDNIFKGIYDSGNQYLKVNHITLESVFIAKILANPHSNLEFLTRCFEETF